MGTNNELVMSTEEITQELGQTEGVAEDDLSGADPEVPELDSTDEVDNPWLDGKEEGDSEEGAEDEASEDSTQTIREYKANGKIHKVDFADQTKVDQLVTLGLGARQVFSERDALRKQMSAKDKQIEGLKKFESLWNTLESSKGNHDALYEKIFGKKFDDVLTERKKWADDYAAASPAEQRLMEMQRKMEATQAAEQERISAAQKREQELAEKEQIAARKEFKASLLPEFHRYEFSSKIDDPVQAEKMNAALWRLTVSNMKRHGDEWQPTQEEIRREFKEVADMLLGSVKGSAEKEVKKITETKKKVAKDKAQIASTRNYPGSKDSKLLKEKDPVKLFRKMFG